MTELTWLISLAFFIAFSVFTTKLFRFNDRTEQILSFLIIFITAVMMSVFAAGAWMKALTNQVLLFESVGLSLVAWGLYSVQVRGLSPLNYLTWRLVYRKVGRLGYCYLALLVFGLLMSLFVGHLLPPYAYDELAYHLVSVANWAGLHQIVDTPASLWATVYPKNAELLYTWLYLFVQGDSWVHLGQWIFAVVGVVATIQCARALGVSTRGAIATGAMFLFAPTVLLQSTTDYTDLAFASIFLAFFFFYLKSLNNNLNVRYILLAGICGGVDLGMKSSAVLYIAVCGIILLVYAIQFTRCERLSVSRLFMLCLVFVIPIGVLGSYWYIHTWVLFGNPVYPFTVTVHGHVLFRGMGSVQQLIMLPNTPKILLGHPWWSQVWISWTTVATYYAYDMQIGGFGIQWTILEFPALVVFTFYTLFKDVRLWLTVVLPLWLIFALEPANWWARYTLFMVAFGAWAFVYVAEKLVPNWARRVMHTGFLTVILLSYGIGIFLFTSAHVRDTGFVARAIHNAVTTPRGQRTVGSVVFPEYKWVDSLQRSVSIGFTDDIPYPYPLYGKGAINRVTNITATNAKDFLSEVLSNQIDYLMTRRVSRDEEWIHRNAKYFKTFWSNDKYVVYQVERP